MDQDLAHRRLQQVLGTHYDETAFRTLVRELFGEGLQEKNDGHVSGHRIFGMSQGQKYDAFRDAIASYKRVATYTDSDGESIDVLTVKLRQQTTLESARTLQRDFIAENLRHGNHSAALVAFYTEDAPKWRLSLVRLEYRTEVSEAGRVRTAEELTSAKRYSFHVGESEHIRTAMEQLLGLLVQTAPLTIDELEKAFGVEPVTLEFFRDYDRIFKAAEARIVGFGVNDANLKPAEERAYQEARWLYTQKLFNRLLFIRFLEKKGWLRLDKREDYLCALWESYEQNEGQPEHSNFYRDRLCPLFFKGLNIDQSQATPEEQASLRALIGTVPYLNGELFEPDEEDLREGLYVPDDALRPVFEDLFYVYNFTVSESTPLDIEVAVDPEMLGKVFEKLVIQRSEQGSYYTPKTVVAFMCREALKGFLGGYADLVDRHDASGIAVPDARVLIEKLAEIKVVDPACGSGAYLLGMLHELHDLYHVLDTRTETLQGDYQRKLNIIRDNLYGADLDRFAVNIAQLRLWLSLIVEYEGDTPEPLPNLHFSIGRGDSLTAPDPTGAWNLFHSAAAPIIQRLRERKGEHQRSSGDHKKQLEEEVWCEEEKLAEFLKGAPAPKDAFDWRVRFAEVFAEQPAQVTIDGELNLGQKLAEQPRPGGFDIVLANPPYGASVSNGTRDQYFNQQSQEERGQSKDTYGLFMARGLQLLRPGGQLCYIVSDTWRTIKTHRPLRRRILRSSTVAHVLDLPPWIFDATVNTCILTITKQPPAKEHKLIAADLRGLKNGDWKSLEGNLLAVAQHGIDVQTLTYARYTYPQHLIGTYDNLSFFIGSPRLLTTLTDTENPKLGNIAEVRQGLSTADNKFYIRSLSGTGGYTLLDKELLLHEAESQSLSKEDKLHGIDPEKYQGRHFIPYDKGGSSDAEEGWLPNFYVPTKYFIDWQTTAVNRLKHATVHDTKTRRGELDKIKPGDDQKRAAVFRNSNYYFSEGITFSDSGFYAPTFRISSGSVFDQKGSMIIPIQKLNVKYLLGLLCSLLARYTYKSFVNHSVSAHVDSIKEFRVVTDDGEMGKSISSLVNQIIEKQKRDPRYPYHAHEQREIDALVYDLYGLDPDDIREIELWYARRYPRLAQGQGVLSEIEDKYAAHLKRAERVMNRPPGYWTSHPVLKLIAEGESARLEFKETFAVDNETGHKHNGVQKSALKTIAGFLNADGGTLLVGISDSGEIKGLEKDYAQCHVNNQNADGLEQKLMALLRDRFDPLPTHGRVQVTFHHFEEGDVIQVDVQPASDPTYLDGEFYVRYGNTTPALTGDEIERWWKQRLAEDEIARVEARVGK